MNRHRTACLLVFACACSALTAQSPAPVQSPVPAQSPAPAQSREASAQQPAAVCPWLTLGTVTRLFHQPAAVQLEQASDTNSGRCLFHATEGTGVAAPALRLTLSTHPQPGCSGHARQLAGIGNHAEECVLAGDSPATVRIAGQVRDHWFVLDAMGLPEASLHNPPSRWAEETTLPTLLELAAEQVADDLY